MMFIDQFKAIISDVDNNPARFRGDLNLLTDKAFGLSVQQVLTNQKTLDDEQIDCFFKLYTMFAQTNIPSAYIVGYEIFLGNKILVSEDTLIPRFETEELVLNLEARIRAKYKRMTNLKICDLCCGSGVVGISLYLRLQADYNIELTMIDISEKALEICSQNLNLYNLSANVIKQDLFGDTLQKFDILVSNPPYIAANDTNVQATVLQFEPHLALFADDNGLAIYKRIIDKYKTYCNDNYIMMLEIGNGQYEDLNDYLQTKHNLQFTVLYDINKLERNLLLEE